MQPCFVFPVCRHPYLLLPLAFRRPYQRPQTLTMSPAVRRSVQAAGAAGVLVGSPSDSSVVQMDCSGVECDRELAIPAAMIPATAAEALQVQQMLKQGEIVRAHNVYYLSAPTFAVRHGCAGCLGHTAALTPACMRPPGCHHRQEHQLTRCLGPCVLCARLSSCARRERCQLARGRQAALDSEQQPRTARFGRQLAAFGRYAAIDGQGRLQQARLLTGPSAGC